MKKRACALFLSCLLFPAFAYGVSQKDLTQLYGSYLKAFIHFEEGQFDSSLDEFKKVQHLDPDSIYVRLKIAFLLVKMGELSEAEAELNGIKDVDPENLEASLGLIFLYSHEGNEEKLEAEYGEFLEKAHRLRPTDYKISEYLAQFYFYKKRFNDAIEVYTTIVKANPEDVDARYLLGYFHEENGQRKKAIEEWQNVLKINPLHADALNSLGYIYAEEGINLDEAESLIKKALDQDPTNGAYMDSLGWVYFKKGEYKTAEGYLVKAAESIQDPVVYEHLGDLYAALGELDRAIDLYQQGLELEPESEQLKEKVKKHEGQEDISSEKEKQPSTQADN